jgi:hypothetical protein
MPLQGKTCPRIERREPKVDRQNGLPIQKSSDSLTRRPMSSEHAATSLALVAVLPRLPFRIRRIVGRLRFAFCESLNGLTPFARIQASNGVSNLIGIGFPWLTSCQD